MSTRTTYEQLMGEPAARTSQHSQAAAADGAQAAFSHVPYIDPRAGFCKAKENTCGARRVEGSLYCVGHKRACEKSGEPQ